MRATISFHDAPRQAGTGYLITLTSLPRIGEEFIIQDYEGEMIERGRVVDVRRFATHPPLDAVATTGVGAEQFLEVDVLRGGSPDVAGDQPVAREFVAHTLDTYGDRMPEEWKANARAVLSR